MIFIKNGDTVAELTEQKKQLLALPGEIAPDEFGKIQHIAQQIGNRFHLKDVQIDLTD